MKQGNTEMAHMLTQRADGRYTIARSELDPATWHGKENIFPADSPLEVICEYAGANFSALRSEVQYAIDREGTMRRMPSKHVLLHSITREPLGIVSSKFVLAGHQPRDIAGHMASIAEKKGGRISTMGVTHGGAQMWCLIEIPGTDQAVLSEHDRVSRRLLCSTALDGSLKTRYDWTLVFVVCANTVAEATRGKADFAKSHRSVLDHSEADIALGLAGESDGMDGFNLAMEQFRRLAKTRPAGADLVKATAELFRPGFAALDLKEQDKILRSGPVQMIGQLSFGAQKGAELEGRSNGTAYAWLNAVTEYVDHHSRVRGDDKESNRFDSAMFGKGADLKRRAMQVAVQMADGTLAYELQETAETVASVPTSESPFASLLSRPAKIADRAVLSERVEAF